MSSRPTNDFLQDILEAGRRINLYIAGMTYADFQEDLLTQDAVVRNLEIIGGAVKNLPKAFRSKHNDIPWKSMAGMRDRLIHRYFGVNLDIVWDTINKELPQIIAQVKKQV